MSIVKSVATRINWLTKDVSLALHVYLELALSFFLAMTESVFFQHSDEPESTGEPISGQALMPAPEVSVEAKWWGYQVHLNQTAVEILDELLDELKKKLEKCFKNPELREAIAVIIASKKMRLKNVTDRTGGNGCQLVSPWVAPFSLVVVRETTSKEDDNPWFAVWDQDLQAWGVKTLNFTMS